MAVKLALALLLVCQVGHAYREVAPSGRKAFHSIKEGHDLVLSCPLVKMTKSGDATAAAAVVSDVMEGATVESMGDAENAQGEEAEGNGVDASAAEGSKKKKKLILWTRNEMELFSMDGTDFFDLVNTLQPGLTTHYKIDATPSFTNLTIVHAKMEDNKVNHAGKYKCTNTQLMITKTFFVTVVNQFHCSARLDDVLVHDLVRIQCGAKRSRFHDGEVKFILFIGGERINSTVVTFKKDAQTNVEVQFSFEARNHMHGKIIAVHLELSQMENLKFVFGSALRLTHNPRVSCGSNSGHFLIGDEKWNTTPACNLTVGSRMDSDISLSWNINGHKVDAEVEGDCLTQPDMCTVKIPQHGCEYLVPPTTTVFLNVEDFQKTSLRHELEVSVHRVPQINCSIVGPEFFNLAWDNQRWTINCLVNSFPAMPLQNISSHGPKMFKQLLSGEIGRFDGNVTRPTKVVSKVSMTKMSVEEFKKEFECGDESVHGSYSDSVPFRGLFDAATAERLEKALSKSRMKEFEKEDKSVKSSAGSDEVESDGEVKRVEGENELVEQERSDGTDAPEGIASSDEEESGGNIETVKEGKDGVQLKSGEATDAENKTENVPTKDRGGEEVHADNRENEGDSDEEYPDGFNITTTSPVSNNSHDDSTSSTESDASEPSTEVAGTVPQSSRENDDVAATISPTNRDDASGTSTENDDTNPVTGAEVPHATPAPSAADERKDQEDASLPSAEYGTTAVSEKMEDQSTIDAPNGARRRRRREVSRWKDSSPKPRKEPLSLEFDFNVHCFKRKFLRKWNPALLYVGNLSCPDRVKVDSFPLRIRCAYFSYPALRREEIQVFGATERESEHMEGRVLVHGTDSHSDGFEVRINFMTWAPLRNSSAIAIRVIHYIEQEVHVLMNFEMASPTTTTTTTTTTTNTATTSTTTTLPPSSTSASAPADRLRSESNEDLDYEDLYYEDLESPQSNVSPRGGNIQEEAKPQVGGQDAENEVNTFVSADESKLGATKEKVSSASWVTPVIAGSVVAICLTAIGVAYFAARRRGRANDYAVGGADGSVEETAV